MDTHDLNSPAGIATLYFDCWRAGDPEPLRPYLSPDVTFDGVLGSTHGPEDFLRGLTAMFAATDSLQIRLRLADERDAVTWSELRMDGKEPVEVANWTHVEDGVITAVRVTFDPRPLFAA
ncbi:nuclear transport factor 2 family protein [Arthrobacter sp. NPDC090010]|uniref:nuclear transport factor 2 family protein n=1 Tax=Arthrobacter sp. NPDC090010 TaxID=3363942 RepID=UPI0038143C8F